MPWPVTVRVGDYGEDDIRTLKEYEKFRQESYLCDVVLHSNEEKKPYLVHKILVSTSSEKLEKDLQVEPVVNTSTDVVDYHVDVTDEILQMIVFWIYNAFLVLNDHEVAFKLAKAANQLGMKKLFQRALDAIRENMDEVSVFDCLNFDNENIKEACLSFLCWNFKTLMIDHHLRLMNLPYETFSTVMSDDRLNTLAEDDVWDAVSDWLEYDLNGRKQRQQDLINVIRIGLVQEETFDKIRMAVSKETTTPPSFLANAFSALPRKDNHFRPRWPSKLIVVVISTLVTPTNPNVGTRLYAYDVKSDSWNQFGPVFDFRVVSACSIEEKASIALLTSSHKIPNPWMYKVVILDLNSFETRVLSTLNESTPFFNRHPHLTVFNGQLYLCQSNRYIETYIESENAWHAEPVELDPPQRDGAVLRESSFASDDETLLLIGGQLDRGALDDIWKYDKDDKLYRMIGHLDEGRCFAGTCCGNGKVYVAGGFTGGEFVLSGISNVEEYDLSDNTTRQLPPIDMTATFHPSLIWLDGGLMLIENAYDLAPLGRHHKRRVQFLANDSDKWEWRKALCFRHLCTSHSVVSIPTKFIQNPKEFLSPNRLASVKEMAESYIRQQNTEGVYDLSGLFNEL